MSDQVFHPATNAARALLMATVAALVAACQAASDPVPPSSSAPEPAPAAGSSAPAPIDWSNAGDCLDQLRLVAEAAAADRLAPGQELPVVAVFRGAGPDVGDWAMAPARPVKADLPLPVHEPKDPALQTTACMLEIGPVRDLRAERQPLGEEIVRSMYVSGTRSERNPDYDAIKARVREAERELEDGGADVLTVGDPMLDLVGLLVGGIIGAFGTVSDHGELEAALDELAATPRTHERPVLKPYHFERTVVRARRSALVPIALIDRRTGRTWRAEVRQRELREFHLLDGLDPRDQDYVAHRQQSISPLELDRWQETSPEVPLSSAVAALLDRSAPLVLASVAPAAGPAPSPEAEPVAESRTTARLDLAPPTNGADASVRSVVRIGTGSGFYVHPHFVVTTFGLVEGESLIDVVTAHGTVPGLLALADPGRGLTLVHVPRPGPALALAAGAPAQGRQVEILSRGEAITSTVAARLEASGPHLKLRPQQPLQDPVEGGPLLLDGRVVGIAVEQADPQGKTTSAVPSATILDFLDHAAGEIPALRSYASGRRTVDER